MVFPSSSSNFLSSWCSWTVSLFHCDHNDRRTYPRPLILLKSGLVLSFYPVLHLRNISVLVLFFPKRRTWIVSVYAFSFFLAYSSYLTLRYDFVFVSDWLKTMGYDLMHLHSCVAILVCGVFEICRHSGFSTSKQAFPSDFWIGKAFSVSNGQFAHQTLFHIGSIGNVSQNVQLQVVLFWLQNICIHTLSKSDLYMLRLCRSISVLGQDCAFWFVACICIQNEWMVQI